MKTPSKTPASRKLGISELLGNSGFLNQPVIAVLPITYLQESTAGEELRESGLQTDRNDRSEARSFRSSRDKSRDQKPLATKPQNPRPKTSHRIRGSVTKKTRGSVAASRRAQQPISSSLLFPPGARMNRRVEEKRLLVVELRRRAGKVPEPVPVRMAS